MPLAPPNFNLSRLWMFSRPVTSVLESSDSIAFLTSCKLIVSHALPIILNSNLQPVGVGCESDHQHTIDREILKAILESILDNRLQNQPGNKDILQLIRQFLEIDADSVGKPHPLDIGINPGVLDFLGQYDFVLGIAGQESEVFAQLLGKGEGIVSIAIFDPFVEDEEAVEQKMGIDL